MNNSPPDNTSEDKKNIPTQQLFLIGLLGIVFVVVIIVSILVLNRPQSDIPPTPTELLEALPPNESIPSITPTNTASPSPVFTFTPKPTRTPTTGPTATVTPQPTLLPSITPAYASDFNDQYELVLWTPELADELIGILEVYPETLSSFARGEDDRGYYDAFQYALFAQQESLLRFPSASQADTWQWQMAYNLARTGDTEAGDAYAKLVTQELRSGNNSLDDLYVWGLDQDPPLLIDSYPLESGEGASSSTLVRVSAEDNGSTYFWLIEDSSGYTSHSLTSDFNFIRPNQIDNFIVNLLASSGEIVGIFPSKVYESINYQLPDVFSLVSEPPQELPFEIYLPPGIGPDFNNNWQPLTPGEGPGDLQFVDTIFPACPVTVRHLYEWNGLEFSFIEDTYQVNPDPELLSYCESVVNHAINVWGPGPTIQIMEILLPMWPPELTITGKPYPEDSLDEWRYRLSIYHALLANRLEAIEYAQSIIDDPSSPDSRWIEPAEEFLAIYQSQRDIYRTCLQAQFCNPQLGYISLISSISVDENPDLINILRQAGVTVRSDGYFDFDNSGETEQWVVIRHQTGTPLEFWINSLNETHFQTVFVSRVESSRPKISYIEPETEPPLVEIEPDITFYYLNLGSENEPVILMAEPEVIFSSDRTEMELDEMEEILLSGGDPSAVQEELIVLGSSQYFTCSYLLCPRYLYLLGLASELANDELAAIAAYLDLWRAYPGHPFTVMARYKLGSTIEPTPTKVATISPTPASTTIGTFTPTPTITSTPEGYPPPGYPPPGFEPTNTPPGYPYPNP